MYKLSIITINFNNKEGLEKTLASVKAQTYTNFELIVIDGGSTDGSIQTIENYSEIINYWVSEKDNGIYDAMNKGIVKASGEYLFFLNSGDSLASNIVLESIGLNQFSHDIVYGGYKFYNDSKQYTSPSTLQFSDFWYKSPICHQTVFIKKELFNTYGLYQTNYSVVADWAFFLITMIKNNCSYKQIDSLVAEIELDGLSSSQKGYELSKIERTQFYEMHFKGFYADYIELYQYKHLKPYKLASFIYKYYKKIKRSK